jgi:UDP-N-acetylenolpyruvoylglucosamine reductase
MKKGPLSKAEKFYIENNARSELSDLVKHLKTIKTEQSQIADSSNLYARDSNKVATIMTEAASMAADESRKSTSTPKKYRGIIHKIKED